MTEKERMKWHAQVMTRALERHKATPLANPLVIQVLELIVYEYDQVYEIMPDEPA